jgi:hypothetical protein
MLAEPKCWTVLGVDQPDGTELTERVVCRGFPNGIPGELAYRENPHTSPFPGDHGIQYETEVRAAV